MDTCSFPDCDRPLKSYGLCVSHRRQQLRGEALRPLAVRRKYGPICEFPECGRPFYAHGLCRAHHSQQRRGRELYPVGDAETNSRLRREGWTKLSPEQKASRVRRLVDARPKERTEMHARRLSASHRARWASENPPLPLMPKTCPYCGGEFMPNSGRQVFCKPQCKTDHRLATTYKITIGDLRAMRERQDGVCAICAAADGRQLVVDHDHTTGRVRGLLCSTCNTGLGKFGDSPPLLRKALQYLEGD